MLGRGLRSGSRVCTRRIEIANCYRSKYSLAQRLSVEDQLNSFMENNSVEEVLKLFDVIRCQQYVKSEWHQRILSFVGRNYGYGEVVDLLLSIPNCTDSIIESLVNELIQHREIGLVEDMLNILEESRGYKRSREIHWIVFRYYCSDDSIDNAKQYWERYPSLHSITKFFVMFVRVYLKEKNEKEIVRLLSNNVVDNSSIMMQLKIEAKAVLNQIDEIETDMINMKNISNYTISFILQHFYENNKDAYHRIFQLLKENDIKVRLNSIFPLLKDLLKNEDYNEVNELLKWCDKKNITLDFPFIRTIAISYLKDKEHINSYLQLKEKYNHFAKEWNEDKYLSNLQALQNIKNLLSPIPKE